MKIAKKDMTQAIVKKHFNYDPNTGYLTWKIKHCNKVLIGQRAGSISKRDNNRVVHFYGSLYMEHRLIWLWLYGTFPTGHIDHINHNELDNRKNNLRAVSQAENNKNNSLRKDNSSGVTGVWFNKNNKYKKYMAELHVNKKRVYCRAFSTLEEAKKARKKQEHIYGFHKNHGKKKPL